MYEKVKFVVTKDEFRVTIGNESFSSKKVEEIVDYLYARLGPDEVADVCKELLKVIGFRII